MEDQLTAEEVAKNTLEAVREEEVVEAAVEEALHLADQVKIHRTY